MSDPSKDASSPASSSASSRGMEHHDLVGVVLSYAAFAALWILLSDRVVAWLFSDPNTIILVSTLKGWAFIAVTTVLLYVLLRRRLPGERLRMSPEARLHIGLPMTLLAAGVVVLTVTGVAYTLERYRQTQSQQLTAVAQLKTKRIEDWIAATVTAEVA